jgi:uncharacterized membrane protein YbhN (UPF0104 family)
MSWRSPRLQALLAVAVLLLAGYALWQQFQGLSWLQVRAAWLATPASRLAWATLASALSFACLAGYERFATERVVPGRIPAASALRVGALAHALSNTLGFHAVTGGAFRYQQYRSLGLQLADVARILAMVALCVACGVLVVSLAAFAWLQVRVLQLSPLAAVALALVGATAVFLAWRWLRAGLAATRLAWRALALLVPVAGLEMAAAIAGLYILLPDAGLPPLPAFVLLFVAAMVLGIVSHAPGGIGVFEATVLAAIPPDRHAGALVALLLYRLIYNLLPFALALLVLGAEAIRRRPWPASIRGRV